MQSLLQKEGNASKRDTVVLLLQDMLEVVTRDMMVHENRSVTYDTLFLNGLISERFMEIEFL